MSSKVKWLFSNNNIWRILSSLLLSALLILALDLIWGVNFAGSDETSMARSTQNGSSWRYSSNLLRLPLTALYRVFPNTPWFGVWMVCILCACMTVFFYCILDSAGEKRTFSALATIAALMTIIIPFTTSISFTVNSALCGVAAIALLLDSRDRPFRFALSLLFFFMSVLIRLSSAEALLPFFGLTLLYEYHQFKEKKTIFALCLATLVLCAAFGIMKLENSTLAKKTTPDNQFRDGDATINLLLRRFKDYPHVSYDEDPELYESVGWNRELYDLLNSDWYFLDERLTEEALTVIVEASDPNRKTEAMFNEESESTERKSILPIRSIISIIGRRYSVAVLLGFTLFGLAAFLGVLQRRESILNIVYLVAIGLFTVGELFYLFYLGRMIMRAFISVTLPSYLICICFWFRHERKRKGLWLSLLLCLFTLLFVPRSIFNAEERQEKEKANLMVTEAELYCAEHRDGVFIYGGILSHDSRLNPGSFGMRSNNMLFWGGTGFKTAGWYESFERLGYENFTTENLFDDNVFFLSNIKNLDESVIWKYLCSVENEASYQLVTSSPTGLYIYHFSRQDGEPLP